MQGCDSCFLLKNNIVSHFYTQNVENPLIVIYLYMQVVRGLFFFQINLSKRRWLK
jgi:hypothetical protein